MRKIVLILIGLIFMSADLVDFSYYQKDDTNAKIKAVFLYNFTKYFEWPSNKEANFTIAVLGENKSLVAELNKMAATKTVSGKKLSIKNVASLDEVEKTQVLFILPEKSSVLADAMSKFKGKGTLIITEKTGLAKVGSTINFIIDENKQKFELNKSSATKAGLKVSSALLTLAKNVIE